METKLVREVMIPIKSYVTVHEEDSLFDVIQALESSKVANKGRAHRDAVVVDGAGKFIGKVTMIDIFRALEPNYKKMTSGSSTGTLTQSYVMKAVKEFNLWMEPEKSICQRGGQKKVADVMHAPESFEYLQEDDTLEKALNLYVMEVHQPLIVKKGDAVTGVLRFGDMFEVVRKALLVCD